FLTIIYHIFGNVSIILDKRKFFMCKRFCGILYCKVLIVLVRLLSVISAYFTIYAFADLKNEITERWILWLTVNQFKRILMEGKVNVSNVIVD
ncbi:MAG: hypothetical protein K2M60_06585, partial [Lachnospiraceae bacterium]|nr:hypothetical protein [Lachnospiraceae bacterium]